MIQVVIVRDTDRLACPAVSLPTQVAAMGLHHDYAQKDYAHLVTGSALCLSATGTP